MESSIDWGNEATASLVWIAWVTGVALIGLLIVGFLVARFSVWGKQFWRIGGGFFTDPETRVLAWGTVLALLVLAVAGVRLTVLFSYQGNDMYTALQNIGAGITAPNHQGLEAAKSAFWSSMAVFGVIATLHVIRTLVEVYVGGAFEVKLREWITAHVTHDWLDDRAYYRNRFVAQSTDGDPVLAAGVDNPDQRIESDITNVGQSTRQLLFGYGGSNTNGLIPALITIVSFTKILWDLSGPMTLLDVEIPRAMVYMVLMFVLLSTVVAFWLGRPLIRLNFLRERLSANFRYSLVRVRDGAESIAFYRGEGVEKAGLLARFSQVVKNYWQIIFRTLKFNGWNLVVNQTSAILPFVVQAPRFFAGQVTLGGMTQTATAFGNVHESLSFFRQTYDDFANYRASLIRLDGLEDANVKSRSLPKIDTAETVEGAPNTVTLDQVSITTPVGHRLIDDLSLGLRPGDALVIKGQSGSGKTTLLRGLAGLWPFTDGEFTRPGGDDTMFLSQVPYIPLGDLRTVVAYPAAPDAFSDGELTAVLEQVVLGHLVTRLDEEEDWSKVLSPGEQQRIAFARVLLTKPKVVFMDEATSSVDEGLEYTLYSLLRTQLSETIVVSVSHRSTTDQHHTKLLQLIGGGEWALEELAV